MKGLDETLQFCRLISSLMAFFNNLALIPPNSGVPLHTSSSHEKAMSKAGFLLCSHQIARTFTELLSYLLVFFCSYHVYDENGCHSLFSVYAAEMRAQKEPMTASWLENKELRRLNVSSVSTRRP